MVLLSMQLSRAWLLTGLYLAHKSMAETITFASPGNPVLGDGSLYSADPGPLVHNNTLYVIAGEDSAAIGDNSFIIKDWSLFSTSTPNPQGSTWTVQTKFLRPDQVFEWAAEGFAYASQIVVGPDDRFYLYAPVMQANSTDKDGFGIGVAVADNIEGPYTDAHPQGPIVSQSFPVPNDIQNIDPTVLIEEDGIYMYWGTFGALKGVRLEEDMTTFASDIVDVNSLTGFFEAPWIMKRQTTYYMLYAANNAGPDSPCTPTTYHACIAYGTASSPLGPWTFQGVMLEIVSSTTSHPGAVQFGDQWYLVYHTADAVDGGNFRRSIAYDELNFDDSSSPPKILTVKQTRRQAPPAPPTFERGQYAEATSDPPNSVVYWIKALNDLKTPVNPLPPQYWSSYDGTQSPAQSVLTYEWNQTVKLSSTSMVFFADQGPGAVIGVAPPVAWKLEYRTPENTWEAVTNTTSYPLEVTNTPSDVKFEEIVTEAVRAVLDASTDGTSTAGVGVIEWSVKSPDLSASL